MRRVLLVIMLLALSSTTWGGANRPMRMITFYVAADGNDAWSGRVPAPNAARTEGPFATITRARDAIRALDPAVRASGPIEVEIRGGTYHLTEPIVFTPQDSGTAHQPIMYAAYRDERPVLSGGKQITGWTPAENGRWKAHVPGVAEGQWYFRQLFVNGRRAQRARAPKAGRYFRVEGSFTSDTPSTFHYHAGDINPVWAASGDVEVVAMVGWEASRMRITAVEAATRTVTLSGRLFPYASWDKGQHYWVENAPDALDEPGEWYLDRKRGDVTYLPRPGEDMRTAQVIAPLPLQLLRLDGDPANEKLVSDLRFQGLTFAYTDWTLPPEGHAELQAAYDIPAVVEANGATSVHFEKCRFEHLGNYALAFVRGCQRNAIDHCKFTDLGAGAMKIGEPKIRTGAEQTRETQITNNRLRDLGHVYPSAVGLWVAQSPHNTIAHNEIRDTNYTAISVGWTWGYGASSNEGNRITDNHLYHIGRGMLSDEACIYVLGARSGTVVEHNLCHDVARYQDGYGGWGIYLDEGSSDTRVEDNVVYNTTDEGFHQHYGQRNLIRNNIFAFGGHGQLALTDRPDQPQSLTLEHNIIYGRSGAALGQGWHAGEFHFDHNLYWNTSGQPPTFAQWSWEEWRARGQDVHSLIADPRFEDPEHYDFRLRPDSPALKLGFVSIDPTGVGPDDTR